MCWKASNTEAGMSAVRSQQHPSQAILARTNHWNVLNTWTTCIEIKRTKTNNNKKTTTMKVHRAQFPGKVQGIFHVDSIMALNSLPTTGGVWRDKMWRTESFKTWNVRQTVIQVLCAEFAWMPTAPWQTEWLHSGERVPARFNKSRHLTVSLTDQL